MGMGWFSKSGMECDVMGRAPQSTVHNHVYVSRVPLNEWNACVCVDESCVDCLDPESHHEAPVMLSWQGVHPRQQGGDSVLGLPPPRERKGETDTIDRASKTQPKRGGAPRIPLRTRDTWC